MTGYVRKLLPQKNYGFIEAGDRQFFFHRDDYRGDWGQLIEDFDSEKSVLVEFEEKQSPKGPRAADVRSV